MKKILFSLSFALVVLWFNSSFAASPEIIDSNVVSVANLWWEIYFTKTNWALYNILDKSTPVVWAVSDYNYFDGSLYYKYWKNLFKLGVSTSISTIQSSLFDCYSSLCFQNSTKNVNYLGWTLWFNISNMLNNIVYLWSLGYIYIDSSTLKSSVHSTIFSNNVFQQLVLSSDKTKVYFIWDKVIWLNISYGNLYYYDVINNVVSNKIATNVYDIINHKWNIYYIQDWKLKDINWNILLDNILNSNTNLYSYGDYIYYVYNSSIYRFNVKNRLEPELIISWINEGDVTVRFSLTPWWSKFAVKNNDVYFIDNWTLKKVWSSSSVDTDIPTLPIPEPVVAPSVNYPWISSVAPIISSFDETAVYYNPDNRLFTKDSSNKLLPSLVLNTQQEYNFAWNWFTWKWLNSLSVSVSSSPLSNISLLCTWDNNVYFSTDWVYKWVISSFYVNFQDGATSRQFPLNVSCNDVLKTPDQLLPFDEKDILVKDDELVWYSFSQQSQDRKITDTDVQNFFISKPKLQPTFADVIYLQLKTINSLISSLSGIWITNVSSLFDPISYSDYNKWTDHFAWFNSKIDFVDAVNSWITLKDIWIANDIVLGLSDRLSCEYKTKWLCASKVIKIRKSYKDRFSFYKLEDINKQIFSTDTDNTVWENLIDIYSQLLDLTNSLSSISDQNIKSMATKFLVDLLTEDISDLSDGKKAEIWYAVSLRINNIKKIKSNILNQENKTLNLLWVYNFYFEMNNASKWIKKWVVYNQYLDSNNLKWFFYSWLTSEDKVQYISLYGDSTNVWSNSASYINSQIFSDLQDYLNIDINTAQNLKFNWWMINYDKIITQEDKYNVLIALESVLTSIDNNWWTLEDKTICYTLSWAKKCYTYKLIKSWNLTYNFDISKLRKTQYSKYFIFDDNLNDWLLVYYNFKNADSSKIRDESWNWNTGSYQNLIVKNWKANFNGKNSYIYFDTPTQYKTDYDWFSFVVNITNWDRSAWWTHQIFETFFNWCSVNSWCPLTNELWIQTSSSSSDKNFYLWIQNKNIFYNYSSDTFLVSTISKSWSTCNLKLYVNSSLVRNTSISCNSLKLDSPRIAIWKDNETPIWEYFSWNMSEIRFYNRAITDKEVSLLYNNIK